MHVPLVADNSKGADDSAEGGRVETDKPAEGPPIEEACKVVEHIGYYT
jgi:hypothetical protein